MILSHLHRSSHKSTLLSNKIRCWRSVIIGTWEEMRFYLFIFLQKKGKRIHLLWCERRRQHHLIDFTGAGPGREESTEHVEGVKRTEADRVVRRRTESTPERCRCGGASPARRLPKEISEVILLVDDDYEASVCWNQFMHFTGWGVTVVLDCQLMSMAMTATRIDR